jgi:hypothetical protein
MHCVPKRAVASAISCGDVDCRRVDRDLVGAGVEQTPHIVDPAHAAADGQRDEHLGGHGFDDMQDHVACVRTGRDVEERQFVGPFAVIAARNLDRISSVAQRDEVDAFDHTAGSDVETRDDALGKHADLRGEPDFSARADAQPLSRRRSRRRAPALP